MCLFLLEKVVERPTPPLGRFIAPRENDANRFRECSSRNRTFSPRRKFTSPNGKAVRKVTVPRNKANKPVFPRERAEGRFPGDGYGDRVVPLCKRRFLLDDRITHPNGRFFPLREKIVDNFTSLREKAWEGHVPPVLHVFPRGGPGSLRYIMMSLWDKFTSTKDMVGNKVVFSRERVVEMERPVRCKGGMWYNTKNFPKGFPRFKRGG